MKDTVIVIPARYASTRFPAKVLAKLDGKPIVQWVYEACVRADVGPVIIATEHEAVVKAVKEFGADAVITSEKCASGTDRVYEAAKNRNEPFVVNVQSDEPFLQSETLRAAIRILRENPQADIATAGCPLTSPEEISDPNSVKIAMAENGRGVYFSRSPVPYHHQLSDLKDKIPFYLHCGLYAYRRQALEKFVSLPACSLEKLERLEQLRALAAGMSIFCALVPTLGPAIDVPEDLDRAATYMKKMRLGGGN